MDVPAEVILKILQELKELRAEIERIKESNMSLSNKKSNPVFHSLSISTLKERENKKRAELDPLLDRAADLAIKHFLAKPPKRR